MNIFDRFRLGLAKSVAKAAQLSFISPFIRSSFMEPTFRALVKEGYKANSAVFACVSALAFSFPEPPLMTWKEGKHGLEIDAQHEIRKLLRRPNPDMGEAEFAQFAIIYAAIGGNVYVWKQRSATDRVVALWPLHDGMITPIPGRTTEEGIVAYYELDRGDGQKTTIHKNDMIQWKWMVDPEQPWRGIGGIQAAAREVDADNEATKYQFSLLKNNGVPPVVVTLVQGDELTEEKARRLRNEWVQKYGGENRGAPAFLEAGMTATKLGFDLQEMAFEALKAVPEARICASFRVPPVIAGLNVGLKRSDYGDGNARRGFAEDTLAPLWRSFAAELEAGLVDEFRSRGGDVVLRHDLSDVRALQGDEDKKWERVTRAYQSGLIRRSDGKRELGLPVDAGDEVYKEDTVSIGAPTVSGGKTSNTLPLTPSRQAGEGKSPSGKDTSSGLTATSPESTGTLSPKKTAFLGEKNTKALKAAEAWGEALRRVRVEVAGRMQTQVDKFFDDLAQRVVSRAENLGKALPLTPSRQAGEGKSPPTSPESTGTRRPLTRGAGKKALPGLEDLFLSGDVDELVEIAKRFYVELLSGSWELWNLSLGVEVAFDLADPLVTEVLKGAGTRIREVEETTLEAVRELLQYGSDHGWSVDHLVRGDAEEGISGLRDVVEETYKNRGRTIARTELGEAQNAASIGRYERAELEQVLVLDNGFPNSDENCEWLNGQVRPLSWTKSDHPDEGPSGIKNPLQHPNCVRAFAPYFE